MGGVVHSSFWATGVVIPLLTPFPVACNREDRDWYRVGEWVFISHTTTLGITRPNYKTTLRLDRNTALNFWFRREVLGFFAIYHHHKSPSPREERSVSHRLCLVSYLNGRSGEEIPLASLFIWRKYIPTQRLVLA